MGGPNVGGGSSGTSHQQITSLLHQSFKNPNWPPNFLNADNVLDYFCDPSNVFYDVSSCNQHLRMQNLNRPLRECLQSMQGIQFAVVGANHPLYVIVKQRRNSPTNVTPLCYYYVVNGTVYQCPDIYTFVQSKLIGAVDPLRRALEQARQFSRYNVAKGYYWEFKEPTAESEKKEKKEEEKPLTARSTFFQRTRTEQLLRDLFEKFPPPDDVKFEFDSGEVTSGETSAADRSDAPSRIGQETGGSMPPEGQQQQTGGTSRQNVTGPASVPPLQTHQNGGAHETGGPMSFPGPAMNGHHENGDVKRFKME